MPVKRRQSRRRQRRQWEYEHRVALGCGSRFFGAFCADPRDCFGPWLMDEARDAWNDLGDEIMQEYRANRPTLRPWGWWVFGPPKRQPPPGNGAHRQWLKLHGYLTAEERAMLDANPALLKNPW